MKFPLATPIAALVVWSHAAVALTSATTRDALDPAPTGILRADDSIGAPPTASAGEHRSSLPTAPQPSRPTPSGNPLWAIPLSTLSNTRDRPIFSSSRRPVPSAVAPVIVPKPAVVAKAKEPERPQLALVGTIAHDDERFGIFLNQSTATALRLKVGEDFQGWILREVQAREATLEKDRQTVVLALPQPGATPAAGVSALTMGSQARPGQPQPGSPEQRRRGQPGRQM